MLAKKRPVVFLRVVMKKRIVFYTGIAGMLLVCSCDKHNVLMAERMRVETQIKKAHEDLAALDAKAIAMGVDLAVAHVSVESQTANMKAKNTALEQELAVLSAKCEDGEETIKTLRAKLDAYKAKHLR